MTRSSITREQAKCLAEKIRERCESMPEDAGEGLESRTWDVSLDVLLAWAREAAGDVKLSRELLALSSWLVGRNKDREKKHEAALRDPLLALKCDQCGADQDAYGSTCYEGSDGKVDANGDVESTHVDSCGHCGACPDCGGNEWVRPGSDERRTKSGMWERAK